MSKPHKCPTCAGQKRQAGKPCPTCEGTGVVWEPGDAEESVVIPGQSALDITDYGPDS